jgi:hypothetical protein
MEKQLIELKVLLGGIGPTDLRMKMENIVDGLIDEAGPFDVPYEQRRLYELAIKQENTGLALTILDRMAVKPIIADEELIAPINKRKSYVKTFFH